MPTPRRGRARAARAIAQLIELLARSLASRGFSHGLNPAQWAALRYVAQADEDARTIGAFARFHLTTPSSASQTISALVKKKLIVKTKGGDSRRRSLELTLKGRRSLRNDPIAELTRAIHGLSDDQLFLMAEIMDQLTKAAPPIQ